MELLQNIAVYQKSFEYAQEHGEIKEFMASHKLNMSCQSDLSRTAPLFDRSNENYQNFLDEMSEKYGAERVKFILSFNIIQRQNADANSGWNYNFSQEAVDISKRFTFPEKRFTDNYFLGNTLGNLEGKVLDEMLCDFNKISQLNKTSNLHFGILGNGITVYDASKTDKQTNDYLTVAHISYEGNIKYYVDKNSLTEKDIESIENQAADRKTEFTQQWDSLSIGEKYIRLYNIAVNLPKPQWDMFYKDKVDMVDKVKKYERSLIFHDEDFPQKEDLHCPAENAGYSIIKQEEVTDINGTKLGTVLGKNASGNFVTWDYSYFPKSNHFNGFNNGHYFSGEKSEIKANADFHRRIAERAERIAAYEEIQEDCAQEDFDREE